MLDPIHVMETVRGDDIINVEAIKSSVLYEGGYSEAHRVIRMFWRMVETEFSVDDSRKLLLFWTGNSVSRAETLNDEQVDDRVMRHVLVFCNHYIPLFRWSLVRADLVMIQKSIFPASKGDFLKLARVTSICTYLHIEHWKR
jgi:hypothetical protein